MEPSVPHAGKPDMDQILNQTLEAVSGSLGQGRVADYIPALATIDPGRFGLAVVLADGAEWVIGESDAAFSIQSISKVFTLTLALERHGDMVWERVGREPSGTAFNSIVQLERESGRPRNPFINAGAIAISDLLLDAFGPDAAVGQLLTFLQDASGDPAIEIDDEVAVSERLTGHRNASLAYFMKGFGVLGCTVEDALSVYFRQCAIAMSCRQLARAGRFLALEGRHPATGAMVVAPERARQIKALMMTCGHYDASGDFAWRVGLPGKSGVGGGILAIVPGIASIAVWSPGLNDKGNSLAGTVALEHLARLTGWSVFAGSTVS